MLFVLSTLSAPLIHVAFKSTFLFAIKFSAFNFKSATMFAPPCATLLYFVCSPSSSIFNTLIPFSFVIISEDFIFNSSSYNKAILSNVASVISVGSSILIVGFLNSLLLLSTDFNTAVNLSVFSS